MHIHQLYRYPVKSLGGQSVASLQPEIRGFADDRRWMFIEPNGQFISRRAVPTMCEFAAEVHDDELCFVRISDGSILGAVAGARNGEKQVDVTVWDDSLTATLIEDAGIPAIATGLGIPGARLVYMTSEDHRPVDARFAKDGEEVSFADGFPYLVTSTASLDDLSGRVGENLDERRFRPNIIVKNDVPFDEDNWTGLKIGTHRFRLPKPCARCIMITQEPDTGARNLRVLAELSAYRKVGNKVMFGMNACWEGGVDHVKVGDPVSVEDR
ncbi:MOSC domain-containing protein [Neolewinella aurantiaca]|uniref:MOSC domain-containing protein n=1 Tax=Neolewinella aurantiaca TaxID=2602767 RepID=A0A5C7F4Z3_9BACT|nr:MOSC N-terminal beta barrel domain-containing protein [Neolewinella aurantiaca]TXF83700.1 MOSC domain-containing protein [Neolewinella aurantiaca]